MFINQQPRAAVATNCGLYQHVCVRNEILTSLTDRDLSDEIAHVLRLTFDEVVEKQHVVFLLAEPETGIMYLYTKHYGTYVAEICTCTSTVCINFSDTQASEATS